MILLIPEIFNLFFQPFVFLLDASHLLITHRLLLIELLVEILVFNRGVLFESPPLVLELGYLFLETLLVHAVAFLLLNCLREFTGKFIDII